MSSPPPAPRKHSPQVLARRIVRKVVSHPSNDGRPTRALVRAATWQLRKRIPRQTVRFNAYGLSLELPRSSGSVSNLFYFGEAFEWESINFIRAFLQPGDHVVDAGANVGMFTYASVEALATSGRIDVFEPLPWAASAIRHNVERNGLGDMVRVHQLAASDRRGVVSFTQDLDVSSHIEWTSESATSFSRSSIEVETAPLDDVLEGSVPALVKLDVEGAEMLALSGLCRTLSAELAPVVLVEAHDHSLRKMGSSRAEVLDFLQQLSYGFYRFGVGRRSLDPADLASGGADLIAVRDDRLLWVEDRLAAPRR